MRKFTVQNTMTVTEENDKSGTQKGFTITRITMTTTKKV